MSRTVSMTRRWWRHGALGAGALATFAVQGRHAGAFLLEGRPGPLSSQPSIVERSSRYAPSPDFVRDVSRGSVYGFGAGLVVGFFSQALTILAGLTMFALHILQRWGMDVTGLLGIKQKLSRAILDQPLNNAVFRLSFATTFTLSAFMRF